MGSKDENIVINYDEETDDYINNLFKVKSDHYYDDNEMINIITDSCIDRVFNMYFRFKNQKEKIEFETYGDMFNEIEKKGVELFGKEKKYMESINNIMTKIYIFNRDSISNYWIIKNSESKIHPTLPIFKIVKITPYDDNCLINGNKKGIWDWKGLKIWKKYLSKNENLLPLILGKCVHLVKDCDAENNFIEFAKCYDGGFAKYYEKKMNKSGNQKLDNLKPVSDQKSISPKKSEEKSAETLTQEILQIDKKSKFYTPFIKGIKYFFENWMNENFSTLLENSKNLMLGKKSTPEERGFFMRFCYFLNILYAILKKHYYLKLSDVYYSFILSDLYAFIFGKEKSKEKIAKIESDKEELEKYLKISNIYNETFLKNK